MIAKWEVARFGRRLDSRMRLLGGWLRRSAAKKLAVAAVEGEPLAVEHLVGMLSKESPDPKVLAVVRQTLPQLDKPSCIDVVSTAWAHTRNAELRTLIRDKQWLARAPIEVRTLTLLINAREDLIRKAGPEIAAPLATACSDDDPDISRAARSVIPNIRKKVLIEALCDQVIEHEHDEAERIILAAGFLPEDKKRRALFFFVTGQWQRYEALDFDQRLLTAVFDAASPGTRQRISANIKASGRLDFLGLITRGQRRRRFTALEASEADAIVDLLIASEQWDRLWQLVFAAPVVQGARAVTALLGNGWTPEGGDEQRLYGELAEHAEEASLLTTERLREILPTAVCCERLRMPGGINEVAFSPSDPHLAIGTSGHKAVVWDFQQGERVRLLDGFATTVGKVTYTPDNTLIFVDYDRLTVCQGEGEPLRVPMNQEVTALAPVQDNQVLIGLRDHRAQLWDAGTCAVAQQGHYTNWARAIRVSPDAGHALLLHQGVTTVDLASLDPVLESWGDRQGSVARCAAWAPDGRTVLVGKFSGEVAVYQPHKSRLIPERTPMYQLDGQMQAVELVGDSMVITASSKGLVRFTAWPEREIVGELQIPGQRLTSLTVSPDGAFMAIGDRDSSMSLWDLRVLEVPDLFRRPVARARPDHLVAVEQLLDNADTASRVGSGLEFLHAVLRHLYRFDIEIEEIQTMKVGEFDIEID